MSQKILTATGENITEIISDKLIDLYYKLGRGNVIGELDISYVRGEIHAYTKVLEILGRTFDLAGKVKSEVKE